MKRLILALTTLTFSVAVSADWMKMGETENYEVFIDPNTISAEGYLRKSWQIRNLKMQSRAGESDQYRMEHDCKEKKSRTLYWSVHSRYFAGGELMKLALETSYWHPVLPHTIDWDIQKIVCSGQFSTRR